MTNIKFKSIEIEGFKNFKKKQVFVFDKDPGLYFIAGKNKKQPRLGSNGASKTSIFDALVWVLKGETIRGTEGNILKSWKMPKKTLCRVSLNFEKDDDVCNLTRTQGPNSLVFKKNDSKEETFKQDEVDKIIPLETNQIVYSLITGQFNNTSFLDLTPTPRLNFFSSLMGLDFWEDCSEKATLKLKTLEATKLKELTNQAINQETCNNLEAQRVDLKTKKQDYDTVKKLEIDQLTKKANDILEQVKLLEAEDNELSMQLATHEQEQGRILHQSEILIPKVEVIKLKEIKPIDLKKATLLEQKRAANKSLDKWKSMEDKCPTCEQDIKPDFLATEKTKLKKELVSIAKELTSLDETLEQARVRMQELELEITELATKFSDKGKIISDLNNQLNKLGTNKSLKMQEVKHLREEVAKLNSTDNTFDALIELTEEKFIKASKDLEDSSTRVEQYLKAITGVQFWAKGFKELRLWVIADALEALEIESNNALAELGLPEWTLKFVIERETSKKGTLSKGLFVMVNSPDIPEDTFVPFEVWCGGESQRLKLSTIIGFTELIKNYKGISFNIKAWDEPATFLSDEGIEDFIKFLSEYAKEHEQSIFWIDQRRLESNYFNKVIEVVNAKDGSGSEIIE